MHSYAILLEGCDVAAEPVEVAVRPRKRISDEPAGVRSLASHEVHEAVSVTEQRTRR